MRPSPCRCALAIGATLLFGLAGSESMRSLAQPAVTLAAAGTLDAQLAERREKLHDAARAKKALEDELAVLPAALRIQEEALSRDVRALYRLRRGGLLPIAAGLDAWLGHASRVSHLERSAARRLEAIGKLRADGDALRRELAAARERVGALERELAALEGAQATYLRAAAEAQVAAQSQQRAAGHLPYGLSFARGSDDPGHEAASFARQRGTLALPVAAAHSVRRATASAPGARGLSFSTEKGASVRAAAAGQVRFAGSDAQLGRLVVVDHGQGFETRYGALDAIDVETGDAISKSTRIGTAGDAPVHFEVRRGARSVDARAWLGLP